MIVSGCDGLQHEEDLSGKQARKLEAVVDIGEV